MLAEKVHEVNLAPIRVDEAVSLLDDRAWWQRPAVFGDLGEVTTQIYLLRQQNLPRRSIGFAVPGNMARHVEAS